MAAQRKEQQGFMLYADWWGALYEDYSNEEIGQLLKAAIDYFRTGELAEFSDRSMKTAFKSIMNNIDLDRQRYEKSILQKKFAAFKSKAQATEITFEQWLTEYYKPDNPE